MRKAVQAGCARSASSPGIGVRRLARDPAPRARAGRRRRSGRPRRSRSRRCRVPAVATDDRAATADARAAVDGRARGSNPIDGACPATPSGQGEARRAASSTCPAARTTTAPTPTVATSTRTRPRPTASASRSADARQVESRLGRDRSRVPTARRAVHEQPHDLGRTRASRWRSPSSAASPLGLRPTWKSEMLTPASPRIVRDACRSPRARPRCARSASGATAAGRRCGRRCRRCAARPACRRASPRRACRPRRARRQVDVVARVGRGRLAHRDARAPPRVAAR